MMNKLLTYVFQLVICAFIYFLHLAGTFSDQHLKGLDTIMGKHKNQEYA